MGEGRTHCVQAAGKLMDEALLVSLTWADAPSIVTSPRTYGTDFLRRTRSFSSLRSWLVLTTESCIQQS